MNGKNRSQPSSGPTKSAELVRQWLGILASALIGAAMMTEALCRLNLPQAPTDVRAFNLAPGRFSVRTGTWDTDNSKRDEVNAVVRQ